jgi:hypothetical protein
VAEWGGLPVCHDRGVGLCWLTHSTDLKYGCIGWLCRHASCGFAAHKAVCWCVCAPLQAAAAANKGAATSIALEAADAAVEQGKSTLVLQLQVGTRVLLMHGTLQHCWTLQASSRG